LQKQSLVRNERYVGQTVQVMVEGPSEESELLIQGRMPTQAQEIDGHVLINELADGLELTALAPGDLIEVEITEAMPHDLVGRARRILSRARLRTELPMPGLTSAELATAPGREWRATH
jgi:tRNA A37 methylthiotransferase MiaB